MSCHRSAVKGEKSSECPLWLWLCLSLCWPTSCQHAPACRLNSLDCLQSIVSSTTSRGSLWQRRQRRWHQRVTSQNKHTEAACHQLKLLLLATIQRQCECRQCQQQQQQQCSGVCQWKVPLHYVCLIVCAVSHWRLCVLVSRPFYYPPVQGKGLTAPGCQSS